jgi:DNA polymerase III alpha subunit
MDIDIDLPTNFDPTKYFNSVVRASMQKGNELVKHPCGAYFQNIPKDPITDLAAIPHKQAQELGYFKIDFLHLGILDDFNTKNEIRKLMKISPNWKLLLNKDIVAKLFHIKNHFDLINRVRPTSIQALADTLALIRPGRRDLLEDYITDPETVRATKLYARLDSDEYSFKRSHAIAYAYNIVLQLHLIQAGII